MNLTNALKSELGSRIESSPSWCISPPISFFLFKSQTFTISSALPVASHFPFGEVATAFIQETCAGKMNVGVRSTEIGSEDEDEDMVPSNPYSSFSYDPTTTLKVDEGGVTLGSLTGFGLRSLGVAGGLASRCFPLDFAEGFGSTSLAVGFGAVCVETLALFVVLVLRIDLTGLDVEFGVLVDILEGSGIFAIECGRKGKRLLHNK